MITTSIGVIIKNEFNILGVKKMKRMVLIEGLDLVGKTTLCKGLVNSHPSEFVYKKGIYSDSNELYQEVVKKSKLGIYSEETIAWMYIAAARHELDLMSKEQNKQNDKIIVQDSFFLNRMIGVHGIKNRENLIKEIDHLIKKFQFPQQVFYVYADIDTRKKRFQERKSSKEPAFGDKLVLEDREDAILREYIFRRYITRRYNAEILDNSNIDINRLMDAVYHRIKNREKDREERE